jgi:hypothetical protein
MRLYTISAVAAAAAALTFSFWPVSSEPAGPFVITAIQPIVSVADDDLTLVLRQQARTAILELQKRQKQF